jgi:hypothetical protein
LCHHNAFADFDAIKAIEVGSIAYACAVMKFDVPGNLDPGPLVHKGATVYFHPEHPQNKESPWI